MSGRKSKKVNNDQTSKIQKKNSLWSGEADLTISKRGQKRTDIDYSTLLKSFKNLIIEMITSYIVFLWCPLLLPGNINQT